MKRLPLLILACCFLLTAKAQVSKEDQKLALELVKTNQQQIGLTDDDLANTVVSSSYETLSDHIRMVYLQQTFRNIPVFNQMQVLAFKNGKLVSLAGGRIAGISERVNNMAANPVLSASEAVLSAMTDRKIPVQGALQFTAQKGNKILFDKSAIAYNDIAVELVWLPVSSKEVKLTWEVDLEPLRSQDHWMIRVDAASGIVLDKNNLTVYEQFDHMHHAANTSVPSFFNIGHAGPHDVARNAGNSPLVVSSASYRVIPFPAESPIHPGGTATLVTDPWTLASGNAVSLQWHNDGTNYHDSTRGNNVWAQEDRDNNNVNGRAGLSTTAQPNLTLDYTPNFTQAPTTTANQQYGITNLFYWNNIMHDISYLYGFDEPSGNFQNNNQGRGGAGNDYVVADAQDAGGTNNANFSTPVDGSRPRMQMYLFTTTTPNRDGDLDNGVINHEYGHGISNRLTGGPANSSCLSNAEEGGEGWSDYLTLMTTTNWATAQVTDGALAKPMGTYVLGQAVTGAGIRTYPYSTNMSINPWTYASMAGSGGEVHVIGEIWCMALWEMTWEMIAQDGINPNLFNPSATGGNTAALKLVMEGMRLQPCSPGYIDARNAILRADTIFFGAKYSCSIWKAFAKRGMGKLATQGSSNSTTDQVASFVDNGGLSLLLTQNVISQQEGLNITYTNHVNAGTCGSVTNYILTDTLPLNVAYVSGGTYNAGNRVVSFPVNLAQGASQDYSFTVSINPGSYFPPQNILDEQVTGTAGTIPTGWTAASTTTSVWTTHNTRSHTAPNSFFTPNRTTVSDQTLATTNTLTLGANPPNLSFWHWYNAESGWDGGVVEISTNGGTSWSDLGSKMTANGYNGSLGSSTSPLSGRSAFTGNSGAFIKTTIDLSSYANQNVKIRFRFASDASLAVTGWNIDDIFMQSLPLVNMRSNLFNNLSIKVAVSDTVTNILPGSCETGAISSQPSNTSVCVGSNTSFSITATGSGITYQWQESTDGGISFADISGATDPELNLSSVSLSMNSNVYRCLVSGTCTVAFNSNEVTLSVNAIPAAPGAVNASSCGPGSLIIAATAATGETIDWYAAATGGTPLVSGSLTFNTGVLTGTTQYYAETRNTSSGCVSVSRTAVSAIINAIVFTPGGSGASRCGPGIVSISATPGIGETIDWYTAASGGALLQQGALTYTTGVINTSTTYYAQARNITTGCLSNTLVPVTATIHNIPAAPAAGNASGCGEGSISILAVPGIGETIDWYASIVLGTAFLTGSTSYITPPISTSTTYYAVARNIASGCISTTRTAVTATVVANSSSATPITICATQLPFVWNNNSYNVGGVFTVHMSNAAGCDSAATLLLDIAPAITSFAVNGGGTYQTGGSGVAVGVSSSQIGINYQLQFNGSPVGSPVIGTGSAISFGNQLAEGIYTVFASSPYCQQLMAGSVTVTITSGPPTAFVVTGGGTYCTGGAGVTIGLAGSEAGVNYQLKRSNGTINVGSPVAGTGSPISFGNQTIASDYTVLATNTSTLITQAMLNSVLVRIAMIRTPSAPGAITGPADACPHIGNAPVTYTIRQAANATSYLWTAPAGASIVGSNTDTIVQVQYPVGFVSGTLYVASINSCFNNASSTARSLAISKKVPSTPGSITASLVNPCSIVGTISTATYTIRKVTNASAYAWTLSPGIVLVSSLGDTGIVVRFNAGFTTGSVSVVASNVCSVSAARTLAVTSKAPSAPAAVSGPNNVCTYIGQLSTATYNIAAVSGAASYLWTAPANSTIVSGQGTTSIEVSFAANFTGGSLTVRSVAGCGNSSARAFALVKNIAKPGAIAAAAPACPSTQVTYSIASVPFATSYIWSVPGNATYVSGQGTTSFTVSYQSNFVSGTITVKSVNGCSTSAVSSLAVNSSECVPLPKFTKATSVPVSVPVIGKPNMVVYPNPASDMVKLKVLSGLSVGKISIQFVNMFGSIVMERTVTVQKDGGFQADISVAALPAGIYQVRYAEGKVLYSEKLVVVK